MQDFVRLHMMSTSALRVMRVAGDGAKRQTAGVVCTGSDSKEGHGFGEAMRWRMEEKHLMGADQRE